MSRLDQAPSSFAAALYLSAAFMVVAPFLYEMQRILPARPADLDWRFGAEGFLLTALTTPLLGLALALLVAWGRGTPGALRFVGGLTLVFAVGFAVVLTAFVGDFNATLPGVPARMVPPVKATVLRTIAGSSLAILSAAFLGIGAWRAAGVAGRRR